MSNNTLLPISNQSNICRISRFVESGGSLFLPDEDVGVLGPVAAADGRCAPPMVTRGLSLHSESVPGSEGFGSVVVVDWLSFTLPVKSQDDMRGHVYEMLSLFGGGQDTTKGFRGYINCCTVLGGSGRVAWHPERLDMGVHVDLPSSALKLMDSEGLLGDVGDFLAWLGTMEAKISRIDIAIDTDTVQIETIRAAVDGPTFVSRCTWVNEQRFLRGRAGCTVYVGSPAADRRVRFYDKAAEQDLQGVTWTRAEIQHRDKHAIRAAAFLVACCANSALDPAALFNEIVDFREVNGDSNISRRPRAAWWDGWLGACRDRVGFPFEKVEKTVGRVFDWLKLQVAPSLAMLSIASPDIRFWLHSVIDEGFTRLDSHRRDKAHRFRESGLCLTVG